MADVNPYLNTPPTKLKRDLKNVKDEKKRKQMRDALNAWRITQPGPFRKTSMETARQLTKLAKGIIAGAGDNFENDDIRAHQFRNSIHVWDLTNAGKRGKKVDKLTIMASRFADPKMLDNHMKAIKVAGDFRGVVKLFKDLEYDYPNDFELHFGTERGVDVTPAGFKPIKIKTQDLYIEADYNDFRVRDLNDPYNEPTCIPAIQGGKRDVKLFYRWVKDNESKIRGMEFSDVVSAMRKNKIKYHQYCAMD